jgi:hypothetical protein
MKISPLLALTVWPVGTRHCQKALIWSWRTRWSVHLGSRTHQWLTGAFGGIQCIYIYTLIWTSLSGIKHDQSWWTMIKGMFSLSSYKPLRNWRVIVGFTPFIPTEIWEIPRKHRDEFGQRQLQLYLHCADYIPVSSLYVLGCSRHVAWMWAICTRDIRSHHAGLYSIVW